MRFKKNEQKDIYIAIVSVCININVCRLFGGFE